MELNFAEPGCLMSGVYNTLVMVKLSVKGTGAGPTSAMEGGKERKPISGLG